MSKSICVSEILCVSEDGSVSRAWALLWYGEARLIEYTVIWESDSSREREGGQLTSGLGAGERGRCWDEGYVVGWILGRCWSPPPVGAQTAARLRLVCFISLCIETLRGEAMSSLWSLCASRDWEC